MNNFKTEDRTQLLQRLIKDAKASKQWLIENNSDNVFDDSIKIRELQIERLEEALFKGTPYRSIFLDETEN